MNIADKLQLTLTTKNAIKQALIDKGAFPGDEFSTYPDLIVGLSGGGIAKPSIVSPIDGSVDVSIYPIITGSAYGGITDTGPDPHQDSLWEFASDPGFTSIIHSSGWTTQYLTSYDSLDAGFAGFDGGAVVYVRVTYRGQSGEIAQSDAIILTTYNIAVGTVIGSDIVAGHVNGYWILAVTADRRVLRKWGLYNRNTSLPDNVTPDPNDGVYNTDVLTSGANNSYNDGRGSTGAPAANYCRSLGAEYFLPSREELEVIHNNQIAIDASDSTSGTTLSSIAGSTSASNGFGRAWTSTEGGSTSAIDRRFGGAGFSSSDKDFGLWVIPVRRIPV